MIPAISVLLIVSGWEIESSFTSLAESAGGTPSKKKDFNLGVHPIKNDKNLAVFIYQCFSLKKCATAMCEITTLNY